MNYFFPGPRQTSPTQYQHRPGPEGAHPFGFNLSLSAQPSFCRRGEAPGEGLERSEDGEESLGSSNLRRVPAEGAGKDRTQSIRASQGSTGRRRDPGEVLRTIRVYPQQKKWTKNQRATASL